jgi:hypothetical protein
MSFNSASIVFGSRAENSFGPAEFFDSFGRAPETYHRRFRNVLIANGPQYKFNTVRVQPEDGDTIISFLQ